MAARRKPVNQQRVEDLESDIAALEDLAEKALFAGEFAASVNARAKLAALRADLARVRAELAAATEKDPLKRLERLRLGAAMDGSWVAATNLHRQAEEERAKREAAARAAAEEDTRSEDEIVGELVDALRSLPEPVRRRVLERVTDPCAPAAGDEEEDEDGGDEP